MARSRTLTLPGLFALTTVAVAVPIAATFYAFLSSSQRSILARSEQQRERAAIQIDRQVSAELAVASDALEDVERAMQYAGLDAGDWSAVEARLFSELLDHPTLSDVSFTHAIVDGHAPDGSAILGDGKRWQVAAFRTTSNSGSPIDTRRTLERDGAFVSQLKQRSPGASVSSGAVPIESPTEDPTRHATFATTVSKADYGRAIWSDLSFSDLDRELPEGERRVVVTVQKVIEDRPGHFVGVLRVGLLARTIDAIPRSHASDFERVVLCDSDGRLVARLTPSDRLDLQGDDIRVTPARLPVDVQAALAHPGRSGPVSAAGVTYLVTFHPLQSSQGWWVGIIAPENAYTLDLRTLRDRFLQAFLMLIVAVVVGGSLLLRRVRASLGRLLAITQRMRNFDFSPTPTQSPLREVAEVMDGLERAKTSVRALGRYVSIDLVRQLYDANREPELGGELTELSVMFTDIQGFTTLSERLPPAALAQALGLYLHAMSAGVSATGGTVDKFIGDAVMAFWNAPMRHDDHAGRACRSVLECLERTRALYASDLWKGLPSLFTRFGVHTARVMVGHFGAPDRISYTALGDGVNLAARLEGLCKQYGVAVLASEATVRATGDEFAFRLVDKVAVKGKHESVRVYELLGTGTKSSPRVGAARAYEQALEAYFARDFAGALSRLGRLTDDPPSRVLADRCRAMIDRPPPEGWDGVYVATTK
jgi:adenylate cyclase